MNYSEAATEVLDILNYTDPEDVKKIPTSFIKFLQEISNKNYEAKFDYSLSISELNLSKPTKQLLGFIYITWWCNDKDKIKYRNMISSNNSKKKQVESYEVNDIFADKEKIKENKIAQNEEKETSIAQYKQDSLLKRLLNKITSFFKKNKEETYHE